MAATKGGHAGGPAVRETTFVAQARHQVRRQLRRLGADELAPEAELIVSELVTNAILHGGGCLGVRARRIPGGVRLEVADGSWEAPVLGFASSESMTGRGMRLAASVASVIGVEQTPEGKVVWADLVRGSEPMLPTPDQEQDLLARWAEELDVSERIHRRHRLVLGEVPTDLLLEAKAHVDNLVREFALAASGARSGMSGEVGAELTSLIEVVVNRFSQPRDSIKRQALAAAAAGLTHTVLELEVDEEAAEAGEAYLRALDSVDAYCRAARLLTLETPPQHKVFRHWYVEELVAQLRAQGSGSAPRPVQPFEKRLIQEMQEVASARRSAERSARLYEVTGALLAAETPEAVAAAVLEHGVAALGATGGGLMLPSDAGSLWVPGTVGYDQNVVARLREESGHAELPAAVSLRTGEEVWIESRAERDRRFPELATLEPATVSICAVPLRIGSRLLGALRFSFNEPRLFDEDERRFVTALAAQAAQALRRSQLQRARFEASTRLQRSLLPPALAVVPGLEAAAIYHPFGDGMEVGGDFYDLWPTRSGRYALAVGDVVGTGPDAAATTALVRYTLRALSLHAIEPEPVLVQLNEALGAASPRAAGEEVFCTAVVGALSVEGSAIHLRLASGGHPYPLVRRADGQVEEIVLGGSLLGPWPEIDVARADLVLQGGDTLVLYTDGVVDARSPDGQMFGTEGLRQVLLAADGSAQETADAVEAAVLDHVGRDLADDVAALVLKVVRA